MQEIQYLMQQHFPDASSDIPENRKKMTSSLQEKIETFSITAYTQAQEHLLKCSLKLPPFQSKHSKLTLPKSVFNKSRKTTLFIFEVKERFLQGCWRNQTSIMLTLAVPQSKHTHFFYFYWEAINKGNNIYCQKKNRGKKKKERTSFCCCIYPENASILNNSGSCGLSFQNFTAKLENFH